MVNKTFLPPALRQRKTPKRFKSLNFLNWHGFRSDWSEPPWLGRASTGSITVTATLGRAAR
jgi:hypothetical protein